MATDVRPARRHRARIRVGALLWIVSSALLVTEVPAVLAWDASAAGAYLVGERAISDLGATTCTTIEYADGPRAVCSPLHPLINMSWVLSGLLLVIGTIVLRSRLPVSALALLGVSGASVAATGLVPVDVDLDLHLMVALPAFFTFNLGLLAAARGRRVGPVAVRRAALGLGVLGMIGAVATLGWTAFGGPLGWYERAAVYAGPVWVLVTGVWWLRERDPVVS